VYPSPDTCPLPVPEALPTRHAAAAELMRQVFPRNPCAQNEHNAMCKLEKLVADRSL
jgi:hypothetical protein